MGGVRRSRTHDENHLKEQLQRRTRCALILDLDLMATPLWVPVKLSAAREGERFERVIAKRQLARRRVRRRANPPEETLSLCGVGARRVNVIEGNVGFEAPATEPTNFRQRNVQRIRRRGGSCANAMQRILPPGTWKNAKARKGLPCGSRETWSGVA